MKKLLTALGLVILLSFPAFAAELYVAWTVNDPDNVATEQNLYYRQDPGVAADADLLAGVGFTKVPLVLTDRTYTIASLQEGTAYCVYLDISSPNSIFKTDVYGAVIQPARIVKRVTTYFIQLEELVPTR
jgi:hypothetical protein